MANVTDLQLLDVAHNQLDVISQELCEALRPIDALDLTFNRIYTINADTAMPQWRHLNLAHNQLKLLTVSNFKSGLQRLESLNLSQNALANIEDDTFAKLEALTSLDLSSNELQQLQLQLPSSVQNVSLGNNTLRLWPLKNVPANLTRLDVHGNELGEIFPGHDVVNNLKVRHNVVA